MRILLLGKEGQVGSKLSRFLIPLGSLKAIGRNDLCLENTSGLHQLLIEYRPHLIVNAAAYTAVDAAENDAKTAFIINETVVAILAEYAKRENALLVHYSTDYVFDGEKEDAYIETDGTHPLSVYGASKLAGEQAIVQSGCHYLNFRTSWVFSATGRNFINTILNLAKEKESLRIVSDQYGAPTSAELIAWVTCLAISHWQKGQMEEGTYHLTAVGKISWYDLACFVVERALANGAQLKITTDKIDPVCSKEYPLPAKRPKNSVLNTTKLSKALGLYLPKWSTLVAQELL